MNTPPLYVSTLLHNAIQTAIAEQGVSMLVLPAYIADEEVSAPLTRDLATELGTVQPAPGPVGRLAELIDQAGNITLFTGAGVRNARDEVLALADAVKAPIGHAFGGKEWMQSDNTDDVGLSGRLGEW